MRVLLLSSALIGCSHGEALLHSAWFGLSRLTGPWMNNATFAKRAGYGTIAGGSICGAATFDKLPGGPWYNDTEMKFASSARQQLAADAEAAAAEGLVLWASYEALSFPERLVHAYATEMVDPNQTSCIGYHKSKHGCISFSQSRTREVFGMLLDEVFDSFPALDGIVFRYGENSPCHYNVGNAPWNPNESVESLVEFISVLRDELCVQRNKTVIFRTWDTDTQRFHANRTFYNAVVGQVSPHPKLVFSIKHTKLDFWRRTRSNPCIGAGEHLQVVEACVGNLFQGMGAYPSYVVDGVINGFEENIASGDHFGLRDMVGKPTFAGLFPVTQGSFTYPHPDGGREPCRDCEAGAVPYPWAWPWLEFTVFARWAQEPTRSEEEIFLETVRSEWGLSAADAATLRSALLLAMSANLFMETTGPFDAAVTQGVVRPSGNFMIHNSLAGLHAIGSDGKCNAGRGADGSKNACEIIPWMIANATGYADARDEKRSAVVIYERVLDLFASISSFPHDGVLRLHIMASGRYGLGMARLIEAGFVALVEGSRLRAMNAHSALATELCDAVESYSAAKLELGQLWKNSTGAVSTLYNDEVWAYGRPNPPGMGKDVAAFSEEFCNGLLKVV